MGYLNICGSVDLENRTFFTCPALWILPAVIDPVSRKIVPAIQNGSPGTVIEYLTAVTARGRFQGHDPADVAIGPIPTCQWYLIKL
jgi:hypothetical protein